MSRGILYPHVHYRTGFRIGFPSATAAWKILDFEYTELDNEHTLDDVARFIGVSPKLGWNKVLSAFKVRWGEATGEWVCDRMKDAIYYYAHVGEQEEIYRVQYEVKNTVINLGDEGRFVVLPQGSEYIGLSPKQHATVYR
jgi:hypothetical protein